MPAEYYERLGVSPDAAESEIKQAFRDRIKETHPDVSDDESASDRTKALIEAKDVLTDPAERQRYDRLSHEAYVDGQGAVAETTTETTNSDEQSKSDDGGPTSQGPERSAGATTDSQRETTAASDTADRTETQQTQGRSRQSASWYDSTRRNRSTASTHGSHRAWETDRSYAGGSPGVFSPRELLNSQQTIALLGTTFVIYPVLLFGALYPRFPTAVNLTVGMCTVLVIAFMQSRPQVGILVFGTWTVLLPVILFGIVGLDVLTLTGVLALAAVTFPLGLSVLTWIALGPTNR